MNRSDFQKLAQLRIKEAKQLMNGDFFDGAYYLAGYAIECAFKACIAKQTNKLGLTQNSDFASYESSPEVKMGIKSKVVRKS